MEQGTNTTDESTRNKYNSYEDSHNSKCQNRVVPVSHSLAFTGYSILSLVGQQEFNLTKSSATHKQQLSAINCSVWKWKQITKILTNGWVNLNTTDRLFLHQQMPVISVTVWIRFRNLHPWKHPVVSSSWFDNYHREVILVRLNSCNPSMFG